MTETDPPSEMSRVKTPSRKPSTSSACRLLVSCVAYYSALKMEVIPPKRRWIFTKLNCGATKKYVCIIHIYFCSLLCQVQSLFALSLTPLLRSAAHEDVRLRTHRPGHATDLCPVMLYWSHGTTFPHLGRIHLHFNMGQCRILTLYASLVNICTTCFSIQQCHTLLT